jgi:hypothetical protein
MRLALLAGIGLVAAIGPAAARDADDGGVTEESAASIRRLEAAALKGDPTYCARGQNESTEYTCRFKASTWSMCMMPGGQIVLREVRAGKIVQRVYSHAGNVEAREYSNSEASVLRYSITQDGTRYSVFDIETFVHNGPNKTASGIAIAEPGKAERQMTCAQKGRLQQLNPRMMPTVFSNVFKDD